MITYTNSDLFESPAKILVNTVNTRGVMGKGIALRFKKIYPEMFRQYRDHCEQKLFSIGKLSLYKTPHKWILNFPTKEHWRNPSRVEYIEAGLQKFQASCVEIGVASIAFPMLGCGNGELDFESQVKPLMERYLGNLSFTVFVHVGHSHHGLPEHRDIESIKNWHRSEPSALPFDEVWADLVDLIKNRNSFPTSSGVGEFSVTIPEDQMALHVSASSRTYQIKKVELSDFWQQLRDHGLIHRGIAQNHRRLPYLIPIFESLPYIRPLSISESSVRLRTKPMSAIQVIPPPIPRGAQDLFESAGIAA